MKKTLLLTLLALLPIMANAYDAEIDGIYYNFSENEATVTYQKYQNSYPHYISDYTGAVIIPESVTYNGKTYSVTSIGGSAFSGCSGLTAVTIPNSVTSIGNYAFTGTAWYNNQPDGVVYAGKVAYKYKGTMPTGTHITIMEGTLGIAGDAFSDCSGLTSVTIPNSVITIGDYAFFCCSELTSINIPNSVTVMGVAAFGFCYSLTSITIPGSVTTIGDDFFADCNALTSIHITDVSAWCKLTFNNPWSLWLYHPYSLYLNDVELGELVIPDDVTNIGVGAFYNCNSLISVTIPQSVTSIDYMAFMNCDNLISVTMESEQPLDIGNDVFSNRSNATLYVPVGCKTVYAEADYWKEFKEIKEIAPEVAGIYYRFDKSRMVAEVVSSPNGGKYEGKINIPSTVIYDGESYSVTSIGAYAFSGCISLTSVTIPGSVTSIGEWAFYNCTGLTSVTIPNSLASIGYGAFEFCTGLTSVAIPNSVTSIGSYAFLGCIGLTSIIVESGNTVYDSRENCNAIIETATNTLIVGCKNTIIQNSVTSIGFGAFYGCTGLTSITIPEGVTSIGEGAFNECTGLTCVTIPNSMTSIGNSTFRCCSNLTSITFPEGVTSIGNFAFSYCSSLTSVTIPNSLTRIGEYAFYVCSSLTSVTIPGSMASIGDRAFQFCSGLTSVTILNSVTSIGNYAFSDCNSLTSVTILNSVTSIGNYAFSDCNSLTSVTIPSSLTRIGKSAFSGCGLTSVTIPNSVTSIGDYAFSGCPLISVKVKTPIPFITNPRTFNNRASITLYVPEGSKAAYMAALYWRGFKEIIEYPADELYMADVEGVTKKRMILPIALENEHQITGLQMDLYLPEGMTVAKNSRGRMMVSCTERMDGSYSLSCQAMEGGFVRIAGFSPDNDAFTGSDGDILNVTIDIDESMPIGEYTIQLKDIVLSDVDNNEYRPGNAEATVKVLYALGDADGSGAVNINDVVCIVNHILSRETGTFNEMAADVDDSGSININDVVVLIDRFILHRYNASMHAPRLMADVIGMTDRLYLDDLDFMAGETAEVAVKLSNTHDVRAVQGNIKLPEGFSFVTKSNGRLDVKNLNDRSEDFTLSCALQTDGSMTFTQYSIDGYTYEGNDGGIFTFKVTSADNVSAGTYSMALTNVVLSIDGKAYDQPDFYGSILADGMKEIKDSKDPDDSWFTIDGRQIVNDKLPRGINIIRYADGTTRKVLQK